MIVYGIFRLYFISVMKKYVEYGKMEADMHHLHGGHHGAAQINVVYQQQPVVYEQQPVVYQQLGVVNGQPEGYP